MRESYFVNRFNGAVSYFTSFGYFNDADNQKVLEGVAKSLVKSGVFVLETVNRDWTIHKVENQPRRWDEIEPDFFLLEDTSFNAHTSRIHTKRIIFDKGERRTVEYDIKLYTHAELEDMGDTDFVKVPTSQLIRKSYASEFRKRFNPEKASDSLALPARVLPANEATETTHFSVVDKDGNAVANTYTLNGGYGSGVAIEGTGILMNNEMDDFTSKPGVPNAYGLIQGDANAIARGKRPLSAMTPTFLLREGKLFLVIGSPGGPTIINTVLQVIVNVVDFGLTIQEAIDAPRFHHQWLPDELRMEIHGFSEDVTKALESRGHRLALLGLMGDAEGIMLEPKSGMRLGASDPRGDGQTIGY